ncbi:hypothetical protein GCM10010961_24790 [Pseudodonghicola xiamenensis]|uniref:IstB-like ATP-binding domain-containing protein n=1 Tax=Pseudodonghicola xiamenensis TaxID=337702 RepID=A0A8J3H984_9RHOB|nr:hypothetical protein GCM10010961_24790 [Pseudodonghicola xiamenensis]
MGDLLHAEINEKQARSIKYQMTIAKLSLAREVNAFDLEETPVNETLVRDLVSAEFLEQQRNVVLIHCPAGHRAAMSREGVAPGPASRIWLSGLPGPASAAARGAASSTSSTW